MKPTRKLIAATLIAATCAGFAPAQTPLSPTSTTHAPQMIARLAAPAASPSQTNADAFDLLPASDIVVDIQLGRLLNEVTPRLLADAPKQRAELEQMLASVKTRTNFDLRTIDRIVMGMDVPPNLFQNVTAGTITQPQNTLVVVQGRFDADALASAASLLFSASRSEHAGRALFTFRPDAAHLSRLGFPASPDTTTPKTDAAFAAARPDAIIFGTPESVRRSLEGGGDAATRNAEPRARLARRPSSLVSMWVNAEAFTKPGAASAQPAAGDKRGLRTDGLDDNNKPPIIPSAPAAAPTTAPPDDPFKRTLEAIRQVYLSFGAEGGDLDTLIVAQMRTPEDARSLNDLLAGLRPALLSGVGAQGAQKALLDSLRIGVEGDEVRLETRVSESDYAALVRDMDSRRATGTKRAPRRRAATRRRR